jgi:hypothetical protein
VCNGLWIHHELHKIIFHPLEKLYIAFMDLNNKNEMEGFALGCLSEGFH